jgi:ribose transport system ATP-binding protein
MLGRRLDRLYPPRVATATGRVALGARGLSVGSRLKDVDLDLMEGEVLGVGGLQNQGQRELFQGLYGAVRTRGAVSVNGEAARPTNPRRALANGLAFVPEDRRHQGLLLSKSVRENLTLAIAERIARRGFVDRRREDEACRAMIERLAIKVQSPEQAAGTLSGGNQQKVVFGKMLLTEARILLLFDPTRGVDVGTKGEIFQLMRDLAREGYAILFYSSDLAELVHVADRVAVLHGGRLAATLSGDRLTEGDILRAGLFGEGETAP